MSADVDHERLRELELPSHPRSQKGADEAQGGRDDQPAASAARDGLADGAANSRDDDENQKCR
jgi:hypothetical protein